MSVQNELYTRRFGGGKRTYYVDVKQDSNGERYVVISEASWKDGSDKKFRSRVMIWKEDFDSLFQSIKDIQEYLAKEDAMENAREDEREREDVKEDILA